MKDKIINAMLDILSGNKDIKTVYKTKQDIFTQKVHAFPVLIIGEGKVEEKRRFLFSEYEGNIPLTIGFIAKDILEAGEEKVRMKESVKKTLKSNILLNKTVRYSTALKSTQVERAGNTSIYFFDLIYYVNFKETP